LVSSLCSFVCLHFSIFVFIASASTDIYTLSLHDALPISLFFSWLSEKFFFKSLNCSALICPFLYFNTDVEVPPLSKKLRKKLLDPCDIPISCASAYKGL